MSDHRSDQRDQIDGACAAAEALQIDDRGKAALAGEHGAGGEVAVDDLVARRSGDRVRQQRQRLGGQTGVFRVEAAFAYAAVAAGNSARRAEGPRRLAGRGARHRSPARSGLTVLRSCRATRCRHTPGHRSRPYCAAA